IFQKDVITLNMEKIITVQGMYLTDLIAEIDKIVKIRLDEKIVDFKYEDKLLSRKEIAKYLKISLPTLNDWTKKGLVSSYRIGSRILYKKSEVDLKINHRKFVH
ncbi:MAG: helix-turn-helix domain-containing protein, partial [Bacteroidia bacterium]